MPVKIEITDDMLRAGCAVLSPALFKDDLRNPSDGPKTKALVELQISQVRAVFESMCELAVIVDAPSFDSTQRVAPINDDEIYLYLNGTKMQAQANCGYPPPSALIELARAAIEGFCAERNIAFTPEADSMLPIKLIGDK